MGFSRQEYWNGLPFPPPGDLPDSGIQASSLVPPALAGRFFTTSIRRASEHTVKSEQSISSVHLLSLVQLFVTPWTAAPQASLSITNSRSLLNSYPFSRWCHPTISSLSPPSPAFNPSQHQGLFQWVSSSHQMAKVLTLQHQSFQWIFRVDSL